MRNMITAIVIFSGLMVCGGLVLRHQLRIAPLVENEAVPVRRKQGQVAANRLQQIPQPNPVRSYRTNDAKTRRLMARLKREEQRQRPQEARN